MLNPLPLIEKLDQMANERPEDLINYYRKTFQTPEGEMVLVDLMMRFCEFRPTNSDHEAGQQSVLIYIKNRLLGIMETPQRKGLLDDEPAA